VGSHDREPVSRFRHHRGRAVAGLVVTVSVLTLVAVSPWFALLLLPPLAWTAWVWRAGTDADRHGLRVRALLGRRDVRWSQVSALHPDQDRWLVATLTDGTEVPLTAVTAADAGRLVAAAGGELGRAERA
jgi:hypothetical protein